MPSLLVSVLQATSNRCLFQSIFYHICAGVAGYTWYKKVHAFYFCCSECFPCLPFSGCSIATKCIIACFRLHLALTMLRTCMSDLHVYTLQVLFIFMVLSLALGLVPFFLKTLTVLDQKPMCWTVTISLHLDFLPVDTLRMLV